MTALRLIPAIVSAVIVSACVTINVYFPAVAAERAADRIIDDVWGESPRRGDTPPPATPAPQNQPRSSLELPQRLTLATVRALEWAVPVAHAQADVDISSPAIRSLAGSMESRHAQLKPLYESGAVGLTASGLVAVRDLNAVPLPQRNQARKLVADENSDRGALYREIAVANKHPEWEADIRQTFAKRWIDRAPGGWWYQDAGGTWKQK